MKLKRFFTSMLAITELELRKIRHDQSQIWMRLIQPILWLTVFGVTFSTIRVIPTGDYTYLQFLTPGVLAQSVIFVAIFYGINVVWERDLGLLNKLMSTPAPRSSIVLGKSLAGGLRGTFQDLGILIIALVIGIDIILTPLSIIGMFVIIILCGICFSSMSMALASLFRTRERMMGVGQARSEEHTSDSSAIYPVSIMPGWLQVIAVANPLSYVVDALRSLLVTGDLSGLGLDVLILLASAAVLLILASLGFRRMLV
ncbi:MAG: ABC transporter permease [Dehalococcoidales bacterium]|jgi:ABC-2 type transport system permease protein